MSQEHNWERRWHPILREWVVLAATTADRPWSGAKVKAEGEESPEYDPSCYLCPGVTRASGLKNPDYKKPFAFNNDFASFSLDAPDVHQDKPFEIVEPVKGTCRVLCFSPKHNVTLAEMDLEEVYDVVDLWKEEFTNLSANPEIKNVLIFENKGKAIGVSNPHPHGQIYATGFVPRIVARELESAVLYKEEKNSCIFCDLVKHELENKERIVYENEHFVAFIPFFARYVYETYIMPKRHVARITDLTPEETKSLAEIHKAVIVKFDNLYEMSFPNITMLHNAPCDGNPDNEKFHFHIEFYPPLRSPDKLKYLAGFESGGGNIINPVKPEEAAKRLRDLPILHYKTGKR
ncbi:MAG: galactose-1-phosphate uridylyltransferase [Bacteroidota bacterium]|nr:galactose-1-phosphate uridylyltransferase [Bacteroidota bacterium]MDP4272732.1 galactose-1-phosphate uridylyltransferase [Bacteroidota bacterium]